MTVKGATGAAGQPGLLGALNMPDGFGMHGGFHQPPRCVLGEHAPLGEPATVFTQGLVASQVVAHVDVAERAQRKANWKTFKRVVDALAKEYVCEARKLGLKPDWGKEWSVPVCAGRLSFSEFEPLGHRNSITVYIGRFGGWRVDSYNDGEWFEGPAVTVDQVRQRMTQHLAHQARFLGLI
ncbi:hypothetical protein [Nocardia farcinica]|uniref:hypothetical protein n=1 Tax=Nocardia farcinica TaxID=37329 RepID=UPI001E62D33A|nr:hypothetical protein [Nocardia farcinica]